MEQQFQCTEDSACTLIEVFKPMEFSEKDYQFKNYLKNVRDGSKTRRKVQQFNFSTDLTAQRNMSDAPGFDRTSGKMTDEEWRHH